jgi:hypothetical protein
MTASMAEPRYSTRDAAVALSVPFRRMDSVLRRFGVEPTIASRGSGKPRRWSLADIVALKIGLVWFRHGAPWLVVQGGVRRLRKVGIDRLLDCPADWSDLLESPALAPCDLGACIADIEGRLVELGAE